MKDSLKMDVCVEEKRICADEPMNLEEYAELAELLGKFSNKCASIGDKLQVSNVLAMVTEAATREVIPVVERRKASARIADSKI